MEKGFLSKCVFYLYNDNQYSTCCVCKCEKGVPKHGVKTSKHLKVLKETMLVCINGEHIKVFVMTPEGEPAKGREDMTERIVDGLKGL